MPMQNAQDIARPDANARLQELILYVANRCDCDSSFGATKLNKILFYADFIAYIRLGQPITGAVYQRLPHGPAPRALVPVKREMIEDGVAVERQKIVYGKTQKRLVPLREANLDLFSAHHIAVVDEVIEVLSNHNAVQVSELSHQFPGWSLAENKEAIPYYTALLEVSDWIPDQDILDEGARLAASL
jgi:Protein of unknown function (DUF4065)